MTDDDRPVLAPVCPGCGEHPMWVLGGGEQAFCGNDDCRSVTWNVFNDPATYKATAVAIDLSPLADLLEPDRADRPAHLQPGYWVPGCLCIIDPVDQALHREACPVHPDDAPAG